MTWNAEGYIGSCLESLIKYGPADNQIIVVDNASSDGTVNEVEKLLGLGDILLMVNRENLGLGYATCQAEKRARNDLILISNPDMNYNPRLLELVEYAEQHPEYETFGPSLSPNEKGTYGRNPPRFHRFPFLLGFTIGMVLDKHVHHFLTRHYMARPRKYWHELDEKPEDRHIYGTSCMLFRRRAIEKIGGIYRPEYFLYFADADMGMRLARHKIVGTPVPFTEFEHHGGYSRQRMTDSLAAYLSGKGQGQFEKDWGHATSIVIFVLLDTLVLALLSKLRKSRTLLNRILFIKGWLSV